ncbi:MAG: Ig-like domain repeat protein [Bacillota bacterium]
MIKLFLAALRGHRDCALRELAIASRPVAQVGIERLESRRLLSLAAVVPAQANLGLESAQIVAAAERIAVAVSLATSTSSAAYGQAITFTATVSCSGGTPTGAVSFWEGQTKIGSSQLDASGKALLTMSSLSVGAHNVSAFYEGDATFAPGTSRRLVQNVTRASTRIVLKRTLRRADLGQPVSLTVLAYSQAPSTATPTGWVMLYDGKKKLHRVAMTDGQGTIVISDLGAGEHRLTAYYPGSDSFAASTSSAVAVYIVAPPTTTVITTSTSSIPLGQSTTFTATISCPSSSRIALTGLVTFKDGPQILGYSRIEGSEASFTASSLLEGQHKITAVYNGDTRHLASTSDPVFQTVTRATVVDWMALYTSRARKQIGGADAIHRTIVQSVRDMNQALVNSEVPVTIRLVYEGLIKYDEADSYNTDLDRLSLPDDGYLDSAQSLRDQYGADLVTLFEGDGDMGGLAYQMQDPRDRDNAELGFSIVRIQQAAAPFYTLAHELGHNFGAAHDVENSDGPGVFSDSYGYRFRAQGTEYHDIMSYDPGITIPYYSNPYITYKGEPIGVVGLTNVARTITQTAPVLASYRSQVVKGTTPTQVELAASASLSSPGQSVLFSVAVTAREPGAGLPMGKVTFKDGNKVLGTAKVNSGVATWSTTKLPAGLHTITAVYLGDNNFAASSSLAVSYRVRNT